MKTYKIYQLLILVTTFVLFSLTALQGQTLTKETSDISVDENLLKSYTGRYDYGQGMVMIVTLDANQLYAQLTGQTSLPIFPSSKDQFYWKVTEASIKFITDEKGNVIHAIHNQNGQQFEAIRLKDETPVTVDPSVFDKYVGSYDLGDNSYIIISKEGNKLFGQGLNLPAYQLLPASETEFFLREINARLRFMVSGDNKASSLIVNFNGNESTAIKLKEQ